MELSTRNQLRGTAKSIKSGTIMVEVVVDIGGHGVVAANTRASVERPATREGESTIVVIKATEVMLAR